MKQKDLDTSIALAIWLLLLVSYTTFITLCRMGVICFN